MSSWNLYDTQRWSIEVCREKLAELRASGEYKAVKLGDALVMQGTCFYHILVRT